jgi:vacuolar iron transporter family protein
MQALKRLMTNKGARTGIFFGATSGVITTIGLIAGLYAGTASLVAVLGGILVVAVADAMSDALGIHLAQEADPDSSNAHVWAATISTFVTKLCVALTFALPLIFLPLGIAVLVSIAWGLIVIVLLSSWLARAQHVAVLPVVIEHLTITVIVVILAHFIGGWVQSAFS